MAAKRLPTNCHYRNVVYLITCNVNGKLYVGQTRETVWNRWRGHRNAATGKPEQSYQARTAIARAMRKYGVDCFVLSILEICASADELDAREAHWIAELGTLTPRGYNLSAGGNTSRRSPEVAAAISAANKGKIKAPEWRAKLSAAHKGKVISAEQRAAISEFQRGRKHSDETKRKRSAALKGRVRGPCSPETRAKIAATLKGRKPVETARRPKDYRTTAQTRERMRIAALGKKHTAETKAKISALQKGKIRGPYGPERRANISAALKGRAPSAQTMAALKVYRESGAALGRKLGPPSAATRAKIAQTLRGRKNGPMSEETKAKIGAANRGKQRTDDVSALRRRDAAFESIDYRPSNVSTNALLGDHGVRADNIRRIRVDMPTATRRIVDNPCPLTHPLRQDLASIVKPDGGASVVDGRQVLSQPHHDPPIEPLLIKNGLV
jgi:group I intron endonuclease